LKAGVLENGELSYGIKGTPQGGVISPLLSNIYLHELDRRWDTADGELVRFADDFVILCKNELHAEAALQKVRLLVTELQLTVNEEKTRIGHVRDGFDFLGFTYREAYSERQKRKVRIKLPRVKSQKKIRAALKERLKRVPTGCTLGEVIACINPSLRGWANYFKIGNSYEAGLSLAHYACSQLRIWYRRKKQRKGSSCERKWPDRFFYSRGLLYVPTLLRS
jgi:group II intron reverse transcriptase/maturase